MYGAQRSLVGLVTSLDGRRFDKIVVTPKSSDWLIVKDMLSPFATVVGVRKMAFQTVSNRALHLLILLFDRFRLFCRLLILFTQYSVDLVYLNTIRNGTAAIAAKFMGIPVVWCVREMNSVLDAAGGKIRVALLRHVSDKVIAITDAGGRELIETRGVQRDKVVVINNGVDLPDERLVTALIEQRKVSKRIVSCIGAIDENKSSIAVLQAFDLMADWVDELWLFGDAYSETSTYKKQFLEKLAVIKSRDKVKWFGMKTNMEEFYPQITINILLSRMESQPRSILETMSWGIPVVATAVGGVPEIIKHEQNGFLVQPGHPEHVSSHVHSLVTNEELFRRISMAAYETIRDRFSVAKMVRKNQEVMLGLIRSH